MKLLVIDSEESAVLAIGELSLDSHFQVLAAHTTDEGFELLKKTQVDAVIFDADLLDVHGIAQLQDYESEPEHSNTIVIASSYVGDGFDASICRKTALDAGAHAFVEKPYTAESLKKSLMKCLMHPANFSDVVIGGWHTRYPRARSDISLIE